MLVRAITEWLQAFAALWSAERLLRTVGLADTLQFLNSIPAHRKVADTDPDVRRLVKAVDAAASWVPFRGSCLHQSLALCMMLRRRSIDADFVLGVYKYPFSAHAWVECDDKVIHWRSGLTIPTGFERITSMSILAHTARLELGEGVDQ